MTAPTLLDEWATSAALWWVALTVATIGVVWLTASFVKEWRVQDTEPDAIEPVIPYGCRARGHYLRSHIVGETRVWLCTECDVRYVSERGWVGDEAS